MQKLILLCLLPFIFLVGHAMPLRHSHQLLLVTTPNEDAVQGTLQRYEKNASQTWEAVGHAIPVVVGKKGVTKTKQEGDLKTPMGAFPLGPVFGFEQNPRSLNIDYLPLQADTVCVDDVKSSYYNQIVSANAISKPDWQSGEKMQEEPLYQWGAVVQYNTPHPIPGHGSCIFMHIWRQPTSGTAGCIAMEEKNLVTILSWLDGKKKPVVVVTAANA